MAPEDIPSYFFANRPASDPLSFQGRQNRAQLARELMAARIKAQGKITNVGEGIFSAANSFADAAERRDLEEEDRRSGADENAYMRNLYGRGAPQASAMAPGFQMPGPSAASPFSATASLAPWDPNNPYRGFKGAPQSAGAAVQDDMPADETVPLPRPRPGDGMSMPGPPPPLPSYLNTFGPASWPSQKLIEVPTDPDIDPNAWPPRPRGLSQTPPGPMARPAMQLAGLGGVPAPDTPLGPAVPSPRDEITPAPPVQMAQAPSAGAAAQLPSLSAIAGTMPPLGPAVPTSRDTIEAAPEPVRSGQPPSAAPDTNLPPPLTTPIPEPSKPYLTEVRPEPVRPRPLPLSQAEWNLGLERGMAERRFGPNSPVVQMLTQQMEHAKGVRQELEKQAQAEYEQQRALREGELKLREQRKFDDPERSLKELNGIADLWKKRADASQRPIEREQALSNLAKTQVEINKLHQEMGTLENKEIGGVLYEREKGSSGPWRLATGIQPGEEMTETQAKTYGYLKRAVVTSHQLDRVGDAALAQLDASVIRKVLPNLAANYAVSDENRTAWNAAKSWAAVLLRRDSGAAVKDYEMTDILEQYFPQPGDKPVDRANKKELRDAVTSGYLEELGKNRTAGDRFKAQFDKDKAPNDFAEGDIVKVDGVPKVVHGGMFRDYRGPIPQQRGPR